MFVIDFELPGPQKLGGSLRKVNPSSGFLLTLAVQNLLQICDPGHQWIQTR